MIFLKTFEFLSKLNRTVIFLRDILKVCQKREYQSILLQERRVMRKEFLAELEHKKIFSHPDPETHKTLKHMVIKKMEQSDEAVIKSYIPIIVNQNLVMLCTVMDIFLVHVLVTVLQKKPQIIVGLAQEKNIMLKRILELGNYDAVVEEFRDKVVETFSFQGIKERFTTFSKIGIPTESVFEYSGFPERVQKRYKGYNFSNLEGIFQKRHDVVHKNELPIKDIDELRAIEDFLEKTIVNLSVRVKDKFDIPMEMVPQKVYWEKDRLNILPAKGVVR